MLWDNSSRVLLEAEFSGALHPIATKEINLKQNNVDFEVNIINENILKKISISKTQGNPFLPYDHDMYVQDLGDHHVILLNKFPILCPHILLCSKEYVEQSAPLTLSDFSAWVECFETEDTLGFYNGGKGGGASQPHRHMQLVREKSPIEKLVLKHALPFENRTIVFSQLSAKACFEFYNSAMQELEIYDPQECLPHNIVLTNRWMMIVPRRKVKHLDIFVNGLNYAGFFLLKRAEQFSELSEFGCLSLLAECAGKRSIVKE